MVHADVVMSGEKRRKSSTKLDEGSRPDRARHEAKSKGTTMPFSIQAMITSIVSSALLS